MAEQSRSAQPAGAVNPEPAKPERRRIDSIDLLRGIVMVIMMLDHTRDFVHSGAFAFDPTDLTKTTPAVFFTRWITHFCAPVFVFLAGTGAYLQLARGKSKKELSKFLVTRGLWLILLELTIVKWGVWFNFDIRLLAMLQVIWVLGVSMIVLAALIHLPVRVIAGFGLLMIAFHNLFDRFEVPGWNGPGTPVPTFAQKLWIVLHQSPFKFFPILGEGTPVVAVIYSLIPWIGVMAVGYAFGVLYTKDARERRRWLLIIGGVCTALFFAMRAVNLYGDPSKWAAQKDVLFTVMSFLNATKYPPSLLFLLMTLGPSIIALALFEQLPTALASGKTMLGRLRDAFVTFGRVPLFFYLLQWYTAHLIGVIAGLLAGQPVAWQFASPVDKFTSLPSGIGFPLWVVYLCWIIGVLLLYLLCKWFAGVKARRRDWWLSYL